MHSLHEVVIESLDFEGKGITHIDGKTVFVKGALPGELVKLEIYKSKSNFDLANLVEIISPSVDRVTPPCPNFEQCGGCSLQHFAFDAQVKSKEKILIDNLLHIGKVIPNKILPPLYGISTAYRNRARLSVRYVEKKGGVLVGFHEQSSRFVTDMHECQILPKHISDLIPKLRIMLNQLSIRDKVPQIEVAVGEQISVLVLRIIEDLDTNDEMILKHFIDTHSSSNHPLQFWLQPRGPDSAYSFYPTNTVPLSYTLSEFNAEIFFLPTEFTQINPTINKQMVVQAIKLLDIQKDDIVADFFCGLGNFTLPIATQAGRVFGIELNSNLVSRAKQNAIYNGLEHKIRYKIADLFKIDPTTLTEFIDNANKWLIDPPREGAVELIKAITPKFAPNTIVYVSCNPATLARDAAILVNVHGYTLSVTGVINMFPHTKHVEAVAVFTI